MMKRKTASARIVINVLVNSLWSDTNDGVTQYHRIKADQTSLHDTGNGLAIQIGRTFCRCGKKAGVGDLAGRIGKGDQV